MRPGKLTRTRIANPSGECQNGQRRVHRQPTTFVAGLLVPVDGAKIIERHVVPTEQAAVDDERLAADARGKRDAVEGLLKEFEHGIVVPVQSPPPGRGRRLAATCAVESKLTMSAVERTGRVGRTCA